MKSEASAPVKPLLGLLVALVLPLVGCEFNPTGDGLAPGETIPDWEGWYLALRPSESTFAEYSSGVPEPTESGGVVTQFTLEWTTSSRTPAQACADFRAGMLYVLGQEEPGAEVRQEPTDGTRGCVLTVDGGRATAVVTPRHFPSSGATIVVTERRPTGTPGVENEDPGGEFVP